jgi:chorismate mutase/prephenate dehydrogenase
MSDTRATDPDADPDAALAIARERIRDLDLRLVALAAERVRLAREVGEIKRRAGHATVDYAQERAVLERAAAAAEAEGLAPGVVEDLLSRLIAAAVTVQEQESLRRAATGEGKIAVVVGGAGRMGRWLRRFLDAQGYAAAVIDPAAPEEIDALGRKLLARADLVLCATPPQRTAACYREWLERPPAGVIADIASIKAPLIGALRELQRAGARVASLHPMFGPATVVLRDADVVICDTGDEEAAAAVEALFAPTTARLVRLPLEEHDRLMGDLLSLAHAAAIAFSLALPETDHPVRSTTFQALAGLAAAAVRESPEVYYEIQADNPHALPALERLRAAVERLLATVRERRPEEFAALMREGQRRTRADAAGTGR